MCADLECPAEGCPTKQVLGDQVSRMTCPEDNSQSSPITPILTPDVHPFSSTDK